MVMARLHVICGNCGCNDMFSYDVYEEQDWDDELGDVTRQKVTLTCGNCATIHWLDEMFPSKEEYKEKQRKAQERVAELRRKMAEDSWRDNPDRMGGSFSNAEIARSNDWDQMGK